MDFPLPETALSLGSTSHGPTRKLSIMFLLGPDAFSFDDANQISALKIFSDRAANDYRPKPSMNELFAGLVFQGKMRVQLLIASRSRCI